MDSYLGLAGLPFKITPPAMLSIAFWAQNQCSYQRAEAMLSDVAHIKVDSDTIRNVTNYVGGFVFKRDCERANEAYRLLNNGELCFHKKWDGVLYIEADGAALNTRSKNDADSTWRENKLCEVFSSNNIRFWIDKKGERQHRILKKEYASYIGQASEFKKHVLACALRGGYGHFMVTVFLSDGAIWIRNMVEELFPDAQHILDFFHLCENVNTFAKQYFKADEYRRHDWAKDMCEALRASDSKNVLKELESLNSDLLANCSFNLHRYISNNKNNIDYAEYEKKGYFIGSGAIESANKTILQDRLKRAGMRWNTDTAQAMLSLKSKCESNLWVNDVKLPFLTRCNEISRSL